MLRLVVVVVVGVVMVIAIGDTDARWPIIRGGRGGAAEERRGEERGGEGRSGEERRGEEEIERGEGRGGEERRGERSNPSGGGRSEQATALYCRRLGGTIPGSGSFTRDKTYNHKPQRLRSSTAFFS